MTALAGTRTQGSEVSGAADLGRSVDPSAGDLEAVERELDGEATAPADLDASPATDGTTLTRLPREIAILLHTCAVLIWIGALTFYVRVWLGPREATAGIEQSARSVVDGTAQAPFQYRILVPHVLVWLHDNMAWPFGYAELMVDIVMMGIAIWLTHAVLRKLDLEIWVVPVALFGAYVQIGTLWWGKVETITSFAGVAIAAWAMLCDDKRRWLPLAAAAFLLAGTRTDLLLAVGVGFAARWWFADREPRDLVAALLSGAAGVAATVGLKAMYADATYDTSVGMLQIGHNLSPLVLLTAAAFIIPAFGPFLLARSQPAVKDVITSHRRTLVPLLALAVAEIASILVVGRADEVRLLFPISAVMAIVAVYGWRALLAPHLAAHRSPASGAMSGSSPN